MSLSREPRRAPDGCWVAFRLLSAPPSRTEFRRKRVRFSVKKSQFKSPRPELVCQKFYLHFLFVGFLNKRNPLFSSVQLLSHVRLCDPMECSTPGLPVHHRFLEPAQTHQSVMPCNHLILCHPLLLQPSVFPSISVLSNESGVCIRLPTYWSFSFNISPSDIQD